MKKLFFVFLILFNVTVLNAAFTVSETAVVPTEQTKVEQERALMEKVANMSVNDYEAMTGKKLNFIDRFTFKIVKNQFKRKMAEDMTSGFNIGGFLLGLLLGVLGVIGAYIFSKDRNFRKWTWIGWGVWVAILLIALAAGA